MSDQIISIDYLGKEKQPLIMIDNFVPDPQALSHEALDQDFAPMGPHYPGLRSAVAQERLLSFLTPIVPLICEVFGLSRVDVIDAMYSVVTTKAQDLTPIQRLPHFDGLETERLALLHYLSPSSQGGTAFYRHRLSGYESITKDRFVDYSQKLHAEVARIGLPAPAYISGDTDLFELTKRIEARPNRALIYRGHILHCADLPEGLYMPQDATKDELKQGRLSVNTFLMGRLRSA